MYISDCHQPFCSCILSFFFIFFADAAAAQYVYTHQDVIQILSEVMPGISVIQIQIKAMCTFIFCSFCLKVGRNIEKNKLNTIFACPFWFDYSPPFNLRPEKKKNEGCPVKSTYPVKSTQFLFNWAPSKKLGVIFTNQKKIRRAR